MPESIYSCKSRYGKKIDFQFAAQQWQSDAGIREGPAYPDSVCPSHKKPFHSLPLNTTGVKVLQPVLPVE